MTTPLMRVDTTVNTNVKGSKVFGLAFVEVDGVTDSFTEAEVRAFVLPKLTELAGSAIVQLDNTSSGENYHSGRGDEIFTGILTKVFVTSDLAAVTTTTTDVADLSAGVNVYFLTMDGINNTVNNFVLAKQIIDVPFLKSIDAHVYAIPVKDDSTHGVQFNVILNRKQEVIEYSTLQIFQNWSNYSSYAAITYYDKVFIDNNGSGNLNLSNNVSDLFATTVSSEFEGYNGSSRNANIFITVGKLHPTGYTATNFSYNSNVYKVNHIIVQGICYYGITQKTNCLDLLYDSTNNKLMYALNINNNTYSYSSTRMSSLIDYDNTTPFIINVEVDNSQTIRVYHNNTKVLEYVWTTTNHIFWFYDLAGSGKTGASQNMVLFNSGGATSYGASSGGFTGYIGDIVGFSRVLTTQERSSVYKRMQF